MSDNSHTWGVILAGGGGTRLWPKSRTQTPKQFLKLTTKETLMQVAAMRLNKVVPWEKMIVVTNSLYFNEVAKQLPRVPKSHIIAEPDRRETALAMLVGSIFAHLQDPQAVVINAASDHVVTDPAEYARVIMAAAKVAAKSDQIVTVGITPTFPSSGFGYIKIGQDLEKINRHLSLFKVVNFTEKPKVSTARAYISTGRYFWNANMYVWTTRVILNAFERHMPEMYQLVQPLLKSTTKTFSSHLAAIYKKAETISIDYAISEKADNLVLIPGDFGWSDVGDWKVVYDLSKKDKAGNVVISETDPAQAVAINSHNNLIHTHGRLVAVLGIDDLVIIDTPEILMVVPKYLTQEVKQIVSQIKADDKSKYL